MVLSVDVGVLVFVVVGDLDKDVDTVVDRVILSEEVKVLRCDALIEVV